MGHLASDDEQTCDTHGGKEEGHEIGPVDTGSWRGGVRVAHSCHGGKRHGNDQEDNDLLHNFASNLVMNLTKDRIGSRSSVMPAACIVCKRAVSRGCHRLESGSGVDNAE
jgi:hypothetical protein